MDGGLSLPLLHLVAEVLDFFGLHPILVVPNGYRILMCVVALEKKTGVELGLTEIRRITGSGSGSLDASGLGFIPSPLVLSPEPMVDAPG
ncbi:hypothetical protein QJS10_CPB11g00785 [Acorus calamus]|uniref:Transposase (putative) gypsy type domain-containing protein n=1 Tax=Acorus calamus TaxID=4465 RepID=A0AAV9DWT2_ACOCL|nr:hypothetical protein QJS10_CPB11g00785 [Acorus calamus]